MTDPIKYPRLTSTAVPIQTEQAFHTVTAAFGVIVPFAALVWLFAVPQTMSAVTLVALTLVSLGAALVALNTWRNGLATRNISRVLDDAEAAAASRTSKRV